MLRRRLAVWARVAVPGATLSHPAVLQVLTPRVPGVRTLGAGPQHRSNSANGCALGHYSMVTGLELAWCEV